MLKNINHFDSDIFNQGEEIFCIYFRILFEVKMEIIVEKIENDITKGFGDYSFDFFVIMN